MKSNVILKAFATGLMVGASLSSALAQEAMAPRHLSITESVDMSLQNSKQLKLSKAKIEEASANTSQMKDNQLPDFKVSGSYLRLNNPSVDLKVKLGSSSSGGSGGSQSSKPTVDQAAYGLANLSLPLFSGFRIKYGIESAKFLEKATILDAENDREDVIQNTLNAYANLYKSWKTIELVKQNQEQQQLRVKDFSNLERNGIIARNDLLKAELAQSNIDLTLLDAENNYSLACLNMCLMLGLPEGTQLQPDSTAFQQMMPAGALVDWEAMAMKNRKDYEALAYREQAANTNIKATKAEYYPGVALTGGYIAADVPNLLTITNALNIGLGVQYNVSSLWKTKSKLEVAKARLHQYQATQSMMADNLHLQVSQAYQNYLLSMRKTEVHLKAIEQADENYRITRNKHANNLVTTSELLDADVAQLQAQLNYAFSKVDAVIAFRKLQQVSGTLTPNMSNGN